MPSISNSFMFDVEVPLWARQEFFCSRLGDLRRNRSLARIVCALCQQSGISLTSALGNGLRQAAHRIFEHKDVTIKRLMEGHVQQTVQRLASLKAAAECDQSLKLEDQTCEDDLVLVAQDTTSLDYSTQVCLDGLGPITTSPRSQGVLAHCALSMTPAGLPLGVVHLAMWVRDKNQVGVSNLRKQRETSDKESQKWIDGFHAIEAAYPESQRLLIIQDREGDVFDFINIARRPGTHLLLRAAQGRSVLTDLGVKGTLFKSIDSSEVIGQHTVTMARKPGVKEHELVFDLRIQAVTIRNPKDQKEYSKQVWIVQATQSSIETIEADGVGDEEPVKSEEPVEWTLLTTMPVENAEQAKQMVEYYTRRWTVERLHYTLKSGCKIERLQIDDVVSLKNALAIYYIVAWRLLFLTYLSRSEPQMPASCVLSSDEILVLSAKHKRKITTVETAVKAICKLGGYEPYAKAKDPGVKSFWIGIRKLESMVEGWKLAIGMQNMTYDS